MLTTKANTFCLYRVLYDYSDIDHIMTRKEIEQKLLAEYGLEIDRRTLKSSLLTLVDMGFDISLYEDNKKGYYLSSREFEPSEIRMLMDSVYLSPSISKNQTDKLIKKLQGMLPEHKRKRYKNLTIAASEKKTLNKQIFYNIDILDEAIEKKNKVEFTYLHYNFKKELVPKNDRRYKISPCAMIVTNGNYYLVGKFDECEEFRHFRIDKIKDIVCLEEKFERTDNFDISKYADVNTLMHGGNYITAKFKCMNYMLDHLIDEMGQGVKIQKNDDDTFIATVEGSFEGLKIWAMHYIDCVAVVEPKELKDKLIEIINNNLYDK